MLWLSEGRAFLGTNGNGNLLVAPCVECANNRLKQGVQNVQGWQYFSLAEYVKHMVLIELIWVFSYNWKFYFGGGAMCGNVFL